MRRRIHNHVEGAFLFAQYPDGHVYYDGMSRYRTHVACLPPSWSRILATKVKLYLVDAPIYAPEECLRCSKRNLRVRTERKRG